jgi:hypothetical protein
MDEIEKIVNDALADMGIHLDDEPVIEWHDRRPGRFPRPVEIFNGGTYKVHPVDIADIADAEENEERFSSQLVKMYITKIYGKVPTGKTYGNWRKKAGCDKQESVTIDQAAKLVAIAQLKKHSPGKRHSDKQIQIKAERKAHRNEVLAFLRAAQGEMVLGRQLKGLLFLRGVSATTADLKRLIPDFGSNKLYNFGMVMLALSHDLRFS